MVEATISEFNETLFVTSLAGTLGIAVEQISLSVTAGSITVEVVITPTQGGVPLSQIRDDLQVVEESLSSNGTPPAKFQSFLQDFQITSMTAPVIEQAPDEDGGLSVGAIVAIGVGAAGLVIVSILALRGYGTRSREQGEETKTQ